MRGLKRTLAVASVAAAFFTVSLSSAPAATLGDINDDDRIDLSFSGYDSQSVDALLNDGLNKLRSGSQGEDLVLGGLVLTVRARTKARTR